MIDTEYRKVIKKDCAGDPAAARIARTFFRKYGVGQWEWAMVTHMLGLQPGWIENHDSWKDVLHDAPESFGESYKILYALNGDSHLAAAYAAVWSYYLKGASSSVEAVYRRFDISDIIKLVLHQHLDSQYIENIAKSDVDIDLALVIGD